MSAFHRFLDWIATKAPAHQQAVRQLDRYQRLTFTYGQTLREVLDATEGVAKPNGTTIKIKRLAQGGFDTALKEMFG